MICESFQVIIQEIGSACASAEGLDDGNILVFMSMSFTDGGEHVTQESLSVVTSDLQTVHEKILLRSCVGGQMTVFNFSA